MSNLIVLNYSSPKKRGLIKFFSNLTFGLIDSMVMTSLFALWLPIMGINEAMTKKNYGQMFVMILLGLGIGALTYYQFKLLKKGTSPSKKLAGMHVLKFDPAINGYRSCTPVEFAIRQVSATLYFPVAMAFYMGPAVFLGALSGGMASAFNNTGSAKKTAYEEAQDRLQEKAATAAGAAVGIAFSTKMFAKFPWLLAAHDHALKTVVMDVTSEQAQFFENGGTWITEKQIETFQFAA